ncbi:hypothetical protein [Streptomyces flaveolus]
MIHRPRPRMFDFPFDIVKVEVFGGERSNNASGWRGDGDARALP